MPLVKKSNGLTKSFFDNEKDPRREYTFYYMPLENEISSQLTFTDEEDVRKAAWYPYIKEGDVILDIGASYLSYTLPALAMGASMIHAFSPEHEFYHVKKSLALNKGFADRCKLYNFGFYSKKGYFKTDTMQFLEQVSKETIQNTKNASIAGWYIPVTTIDEFMQETPMDKIDFLKLDTEGAEYSILLGGIETLKKYHPKILIEYHLFKDSQLRIKSEGFLNELGYKAQIILDIARADLPHVLYY